MYITGIKLQWLNNNNKKDNQTSNEYCNTTIFDSFPLSIIN